MATLFGHVPSCAPSPPRGRSPVAHACFTCFTLLAPGFSNYSLKMRFSVLNGTLSWVLTLDSGLGREFLRYRSKMLRSAMIAVILQSERPGGVFNTKRFQFKCRYVFCNHA